MRSNALANTHAHRTHNTLYGISKAKLNSILMCFKISVLEERKLAF